MLAEHRRGDEGDGQAGRVGDLLPGEVLAALGVDGGGGQGLAGGGVELGVDHGKFLFRSGVVHSLGCGLQAARTADRPVAGAIRSTVPVGMS